MLGLLMNFRHWKEFLSYFLVSHSTLGDVSLTLVPNGFTDQDCGKDAKGRDCSMVKNKRMNVIFYINPFFLKEIKM